MPDDTAKSTAPNYPWLIALVILWHVVLAAMPRYGGFNVPSAITSLRAINSGQVAYASTCAAGSYAVGLADLAKPPVGGSDAFISPDLVPDPPSTSVTRSGYVITLTNGVAKLTDSGLAKPTCNDSTGPPASSYFASANPVVGGVWDVRPFFATDERGTIFVSRAGPIANPIPAGVPVVGEEGDVRGFVSSEDWRFWAELLLMVALLAAEAAIIWIVLRPASYRAANAGRPLAAFGLALYGLIRAFPGTDAATIKYNDLHIEVLLVVLALLFVATATGAVVALSQKLRKAQG